MADVGHARRTRIRRTSPGDEPQDVRITFRVTGREHARLIEEAGGRDISTYVRHRLADVGAGVADRAISDCREALMVLDGGFDLLVALEEHLACGGRADDSTVLLALEQTHDCLDATRLALVRRVAVP